MSGKNSRVKTLKIRKYTLTFACWIVLPIVAAILIALQYEEKMPNGVLEHSTFKSINDMIPNPFSVEIFAILMFVVLVLLGVTYYATKQTNDAITKLYGEQKKLSTHTDVKALKENLVKLDKILEKREELNKAWMKDNFHDDSEMIDAKLNTKN